MARRVEDFEIDPAVVPIDEEPAVTFRAWLESLPKREPCDPGVEVAEVIREIRESGEH
jgi:hypothetical protein